jgi:putative SOS response-associated peptidase YedK
MCGRYALYGPISRKRPPPPAADDWFAALAEAIEMRKPRYNFAPTQVSPIVGVSKDDQIGVHDLHWGLVPFWAKNVKIGYKAINARVETVAEKPMFRSAFKERRCLVPARGYFEWKGEKPPKQPYFIHEPAGQLMLFAGLWETWRPKEGGDPLYTYTIVTGPPGLVSGDVHDRAPVILPPEQWMPWLTGTPADAQAILAAVPDPPLTYHAVSKDVGSPKNDREDLVEPIEA